MVSKREIVRACSAFSSIFYMEHRTGQKLKEHIERQEMVNFSISEIWPVRQPQREVDGMGEMARTLE